MLVCTGQWNAKSVFHHFNDVYNSRIFCDNMPLYSSNELKAREFIDCREKIHTLLYVYILYVFDFCYINAYRFHPLPCRYRPPSRYFITTQAVPAIYKKCMSRMKSQIKRIGHRVSITTDGWKNICNTGFVTLTGRYVGISNIM